MCSVVNNVHKYNWSPLTHHLDLPQIPLIYLKQQVYLIDCDSTSTFFQWLKLFIIIDFAINLTK